MPNKAQRSRGSGFKRETDLLRRVDTRRERRSVLVVTNGVSTEVDYFDALRREPWIRADKVKVKFVPGEPAAIVLRAASIRDDNAYDEAWVVCDVDEFDLKSAVTTAAEREVELALSLPCFEIWLILHLSAGCPRFNNATQVSRHLKNLLPNWEKTGLKFSDFSAGVSDAAVRAKRLGEPPDANPSTAVWRLIESLRNPPESI
jgi:hypothetical protein